jgi:hypothetical protein
VTDQPSSESRRVDVDTRVGDVLVHARVAEAFASDATRLLEMFGAGAGGAYDGAELDAGWGPVRLRSSGSDLVAICPDYRGMFPEDDETEDITDALWVPALQRRLHVASGIPAGPTTRFDQLVYETDLAWTTETVCLRRHETDGSSNSGWLADIAVPPHPPTPWHEAYPEFASALFGHRPSFLAVLSLPAGYVAVGNRSGLSAIHDETGAIVFDGPFPDTTLP